MAACTRLVSRSLPTLCAQTHARLPSYRSLAAMHAAARLPAAGLVGRRLVAAVPPRRRLGVRCLASRGGRDDKSWGEIASEAAELAT